MNKIFYKIFGIYLLVLVPLIVTILILVFNVISSNYLDTLTNDLRNINYAMQGSFAEHIKNQDLDALNSKTAELGENLGIRITIIKLDGNVLADSKKDPETMENHAGRSEVIKAAKGITGSSLRYSVTVKKSMLYVALPFYIDGNIVAVTRVSLYVDDIDKLNSELRWKIIFYTALIFIAALFLLMIFSKNLTNPILELTAASQKVAKGDFDTKVLVKNNDEIKLLADNFNEMTDKIKYLFNQMSLQQNELKSIIDSLQEGLLVIDTDNKIILYNKSFKKQFPDEESFAGRLFWEILRDMKIQNLVEKVINKQASKTIDIHIGDKDFLCNANYIPGKNEILITLFDISERKKLEEMKKDFIVNVSHELKTPLTAIKGFVETLEDEARENNQQINYLEIIERHTARLISIVNDLLAISELEDKNIKLEYTDIDIKKLTDNVTKLFEERLKEKNLKFELQIDDNIESFKADYFKMEQLFINLIDNAVKYTPQGEIAVKITKAKKDVEIIIEDTGVGIPKESIDRIFERFYTVDKSHSRRNGGTGLGLSIVKHIVNMHRGTLTVESRKEQGTAFIIKIPIDPKN